MSDQQQPPVYKIALGIEYDGSKYYGWQRQNEVRSVQEKLEKALAFDSDVVTSVIKNIDVLKTLFNTYMTDVARKDLDLSRGRDDKSKERAIEYFQDKETRESFFRFL